MTGWVYVLDVNYLAYRALYSTGGLNHAGAATGVVFGVMKTVQGIQDRHPDATLVFCFDHGKGVREEVFPGYKATRRAKRKEEMRDPKVKKMYDAFGKQVEQLRTKLLREAGYRNVFYQEGYEADDLMAQVVRQRDKADRREYILVSGDHDLYQCVSHRVGVWHPSPPGAPVVRASEFVDKYGLILPAQWKQVKAIAGCSTDDVPGVPGIGEKKAAAFVGWATDGDSRKPCPGVGADKVNEILEFICSKEYVRNKFLVSLPLPGTEPVKVRADAPNPDAWNRVCYGIGAQSLVKGGDGPKSRLQGVF